MRRNQKGFSPIIILLILLILILLGFVGYYVFKKQDTKEKPAASSSSQPSNAAPVVDENKDYSLIKIPELGIQFTVANSIKDISYTVRDVEYDDGVMGKGADIYTDAIVALDPNCKITPAFGGLFTVDGEAPKTQDTQTAKPTALKQFDKFYVSYSGGQADCTDANNQAAFDYLTTAKPDFVKALNTIELIP